MTRDYVKQAVKFVTELGLAFHSYGAAAHSIESAMHKISASLNIKGNFFVTPTLLMSSFTTSEGDKSSIKRVTPAGTNLTKMLELDELGDLVIDKKITVGKAHQMLKKIKSTPARYPEWLEMLSFALACITASVFLGGSANDLIATCISSVIVAFTFYISMKFEEVNKFSEFIAAFVAALVPALLFTIQADFSIQIVTIASLIVLVPGLKLTIAMTELATDNLVAGTARLMSAFLSFLKMGFGVLLAYKLSMYFCDGIQFIETQALNDVAIFISIVFATLSFVIIFQARMQEALYVFLTALIAFVTYKYSIPYFGAVFATFTSALVLGASGNVYSRVLKHPAAIVQMPALLLLVPGSIGFFRGVAFLFEKNTIAGINTAVDMIMIATALVAGLLLANIIISPRRSF